MKKLAFYFAALALFSFSSFGFEWGGKFVNKTDFEGKEISDLELVQNDSISLWLTSPLTKDNSLNFAFEAYYGLEYNKESDDLKHTADLNLLKISKNFSAGETGTVVLNAGRFGLCDTTGIILSQKIDGAHAEYFNEDLSVSAFVSYTGLLNYHTTTIISSRYPEDIKDVYSFCEKYIPFGATFVYNSLPGSNKITVQALGFKDLEDDPHDRFYVTADGHGFITPVIAYGISTTFGTEDFDNVTNLSVMNVSAYIKNKAMISLNGTYASGDTGAFNSFKGFTSQSAYDSLSEPEYTDLIKIELNGNYAVTDEGIVSCGAAAVFNSECEYQGFQWKAGTLFNILDDLKLALNLGQFYGDDSETNKTFVNLNATFNF